MKNLDMVPLRHFGMFGLCWLGLAAAGAAAASPAKVLPAAIVPPGNEPGSGAAPAFLVARPIWPTGREREMNLTVGFRASFPRPEGIVAVLRVTGSSLYRVHLNGGFVGHGPARAAHGHFRVDEWVLPAGLLKDENIVAIEVAGYNANSYYLVDQPSFLQAEVVADGKVLAATGTSLKPFEATIPGSRIQKVERYSFQRTFMESYRLQPGFDAWRTPLWDGAGAVACSVQSGGKMLPRRVAYPRFEVRQPGGKIVTGEMRQRGITERPWRVLGRRSIGPTMDGFRDEEVGRLVSREMQGWTTASAAVSDDPYGPGIMRRLGAAGYDTYDFGVNLTGFIGVSIRCGTPTRLVLSFDEILSNGDVDHQRLNCLNLIELDCAPGTYRFETLEPYTLRFLKAVVLEGECEIGGITLREYAASDLWEASFSASDPRLNDIFEAARETCRQNAVDLFMDCPSRERAAWLCDSFFAARVSRDLSGHARVEENFLENYLLPETFANMPPGMVPPCYPADQTEGRFIPNWALFLVIQLEEYLARSGDRAMVAAFEPRVMALLEYFRRYENEEGLLEKLESWVFVEWSVANKYVQDVSFPTCAVYAGALAAAGRMHGRADLQWPIRTRQVLTLDREEARAWDGPHAGTVAGYAGHTNGGIPTGSGFTFFPLAGATHQEEPPGGAATTIGLCSSVEACTDSFPVVLDMGIGLQPCPRPRRRPSFLHALRSPCRARPRAPHSGLVQR